MRDPACSARFSGLRPFLLLILLLALFPASGAAADTPEPKNYFYFEGGDFGVEHDADLISPNFPAGWTLSPIEGGSTATWIRNNPLTRLHASPSGDKFNKLLEFSLQPDSPVTMRTDVFAVDPLDAYQLSGWMKTEGNFVSETRIAIELLDDKGAVVKTVSTSDGDFSLAWKEIESPYFIVPAQCVAARLVLSTRTKGAAGKAWVDQVFLRNYNLSFEVDNDDNEFPDNWRPYYNEPEGFREFPGGNRMYLVTDDVKEGSKALRMDLQEGNVAIETEDFIPVDPQGSYQFSGALKTSDDSDIEAQFELLFYDENHRPLPEADIRFDRIHGSLYWDVDDPRKQYLKYIEHLASERARYARIRINLYGNGAIRGSAWFDRLAFVPLPRIVVVPVHASLDAVDLEYDPERLFVFMNGEPAHFKVRAENLVEDNYWHRIRVQNVWGEELADYSSPRRFVSRKEGRRYEMEVPVDVSEPGYMLMEILLYRNDVQVAGKHVSFGILERTATPAGRQARVGLSVEPFRDDYLTLMPLLQALNPGAVKLPAWYRELQLQALTHENGRRLGSLSKQLRQAGIRPVGVYGAAWLPDELRDGLSATELPEFRGMHSIYRARQDAWTPYLIKQIKSMGAQIEDWQMLDDFDVSMRGRPDVAKLAKAFEQSIHGTASWAKIAMPMSALDTSAPPAGVDVVSWALPPDMAWRDIRARLQSDRAAEPPRENWYQLGVIDNRGDLQRQRIEQLAKQMIEVLSDSSARAFYDTFIDESRGLVRDNLQPKPEYFVVRTLSDMIGAATPQTPLSLENPAIINRVFTRGDDDMILVIWTDGPDMTEKLYLGENLVRVDLMGVETQVGRKDRAYDMNVSSMPVIYTGVDRDMLMTRLSFAVDNPIMESTSDPQRRQFTITNHFDSPLSGTVELLFPQTWNLSNRRLSITSLGPGETSEPFIVDMVVGVLAPVGDTRVEMVYDFVLQEKGIRHSNIRDRRTFTVISPLMIKSTVAKKSGDDGVEYLDVSVEFVNKSARPISAVVEFQLVGAASREWQKQVYNVAPGGSQVMPSLKLPAQFEGNLLSVYVRETGGGGRFMNTEIPLIITR